MRPARKHAAAVIAAAVAGPIAAAVPVAAPDFDTAVKSAVAAYTLVEVAAGCGWISGSTDVRNARTGALAFAMSGMPVERKAAVLGKLFEDDEKLLVAATSAAQARVRKGECTSGETRKIWADFGTWLALSAKAAERAAAGESPPKPAVARPGVPPTAPPTATPTR